MNQANPQAGRTLAGNVPITVEMELIALRNLGPKKAK
jgi:hypothetical protein